LQKAAQFHLPRLSLRVIDGGTPQKTEKRDAPAMALCLDR
jgi:hypothetical protein